MYPIQCHAGFAMPVKAGKMEIVGFHATVDLLTATSEFAIVDDNTIKPDDKWGHLLGTIEDQDGIIVYCKGLGSIDTSLDFVFPEPIKTRYGISIYGDNLLAGSVCVYVR